MVGKQWVRLVVLAVLCHGVGGGASWAGVLAASHVDVGDVGGVCGGIYHYDDHCQIQRINQVSHLDGALERFTLYTLNKKSCYISTLHKKYKQIKQALLNLLITTTTKTFNSTNSIAGTLSSSKVKSECSNSKGCSVIES